MDVRQKPAVGRSMRVTHRLAGHRALAANRTFKSHRGSILPDCTLESKGQYPLQFFKGVGPARAEALAAMGLVTPADLLMYFPRDWEDRRLRFSIREAP